MSGSTDVRPDDTWRTGGPSPRPGIMQPESPPAGSSRSHATITVGSSAVGIVSADPAEMRARKIGGEPVDSVDSLQYETGYSRVAVSKGRRGGHPHLVIPLRVEMNRRPAERTIALVSLDVTMRSATSATVWRCVPLDLVNGMSCRSRDVDEPVTTTLQAEFAVGAVGISELERSRQQTLSSVPGRRDGRFPLFLELSGRVAALATYGGIGGIASHFEAELGPHSQMSWFWNTVIEDITLFVDHDRWVSHVIPTFKPMLRRGR